MVHTLERRKRTVTKRTFLYEFKPQVKKKARPLDDLWFYVYNATDSRARYKLCSTYLSIECVVQIYYTGQTRQMTFERREFETNCHNNRKGSRMTSRMYYNNIIYDIFVHIFHYGSTYYYCYYRDKCEWARVAGDKDVTLQH
jgi:hypothetical protein